MLAEICLHNKLHIASFYQLKGNTDNFGDYPMLFFCKRLNSKQQILTLYLNPRCYELQKVCLIKDDSKNICLKKTKFLGICSSRYDHS